MKKESRNFLYFCRLYFSGMQSYENKVLRVWCLSVSIQSIELYSTITTVYGSIHRIIIGIYETLSTQSKCQSLNSKITIHFGLHHFSTTQRVLKNGWIFIDIKMDTSKFLSTFMIWKLIHTTQWSYAVSNVTHKSLLTNRHYMCCVLNNRKSNKFF